MRRATRVLFLAAGFAVSSLLGGCLVRHHGHVAWVAPPPVVAAAVTAAIVGHIWVDGHWDWIGGQWVWTDGTWVRDRPGFVWVQGAWIPSQGRYVWRPGRWQARADRIHVRDHRVVPGPRNRR